MTAEETEVLIVGAGPVGMVVAIDLARRGMRFVLIDAAPDAQNTSRAAVIHAATLDALAGLDLDAPLLRQGIVVPQFRIRERDRVLFPVSFAGLPTAHPYTLMIPQDETEAILTRRLADLGHAPRRPWRLDGLTAEAGHAIARCVTHDGERLIRARWIVGADGQNSATRAAAGIGFPGHTYGSFILADVRMDWPIPREEVTLFFSPAGTLVVAPMSDDRYRIVAQYPNAPPHPTPREVEQVLWMRGPSDTPAAIREMLWSSRFQIHHRLADRFRAGPVLLAGDAAHIHSPAGGQGMNLGLRDAVALADALAASDVEAAADHYALERRARAGAVLAMTNRLTAVATLRSPVARGLRDIVLAGAGRIPRLQRAAAMRLAGLA